MARMIKRYWWLALLQLALIVGAGVFLTSRMLHHVQPAVARDGTPPATQPVDRLSYGRVQGLRQALSLTNEDLAAMGCDQATAQTMIGGLLSWYQSNQSTWNEKEAAVVSARAAYGQTLRQINVGPQSDTLDTQLATQKQALATASDAWSQFIEGAATSASSNLSADQKAVWASARTNTSLPDRYRYTSGAAAADVAKLKALLSKRGEGSAQLTELEQNLLNSTIRGQITTARSNVSTHLADVATAESSSLPRPPLPGTEQP
jgi:hypothetical protein